MLITDVNYLDIKKLVSELTCSAKRKNNILVPMRSVFKMAFLSGIVDRNPMERVKNLKTTKPDIKPMSMDEVKLLLNHVSERYRNFFIAAFFTGMRFGEMAGLKWKHVDFKMRLIKVRETRVKGEEGRPKTRKSVRDIKILPPLMEALTNQKKKMMGHETLQMIYEKYYSYIKNYERDEGSAFMDKVFNPSMNQAQHEITLGQQS